MSVNETNEAARLRELASYQILDTAPEAQFDAVVEIARALFGTPAAAISLIDSQRQWHKARSGPVELEAPREISFCSHTVEARGPFIVGDARTHSAFAQNPLVTGDPGIRFYAGLPLTTPNGHALGALCVMSDEPRPEFSPEDLRRLILLRDIVTSELELRRLSQHLAAIAGAPGESLEEMRFRLRIGIDYAALLDDVSDTSLPITQLVAIAKGAWRYHLNAGEVVANTIRSLRARMPTVEFRSLIGTLPGFTL